METFSVEKELIRMRYYDDYTQCRLLRVWNIAGAGVADEEDFKWHAQAAVCMKDSFIY
ncbi:MAG: hypothetical protein ACLS9K_01535 [Lachnospira eligens]